MIGRFGRRGAGSDGGMTLVELLVSMSLLSVVMALSTVFFVSLQQTNRYTDAYAQDLFALRQAASRLTAELRESNQVITTSTSTSLTLWIDKNRDGTQDNGELITYALATGTDGSGTSVVQLRRSVNGTTGYAVVAQGLTNSAAFTYYTAGTAGAASATTSMVAVQLTGTVTVAGQHPTPPVITTEIFLRNQ
jgi:prepilin-type N-terminal cleavage/methylation domain-containing protein